MQRRLILSSSALILIVVFSIAFLAPNSRVNAQSTASTPTVTPTTTADANQILQQTIDARDKAVDAKNVAEEAALQAEGVISAMNLIFAMAAIIVSGAVGILSFIGYNRLKSFRVTQEDFKKVLVTAQDNYEKELENLKALRTETEQLRVDFQHVDLAFASLRLGDVLFENGKRDMAIEAYEDAQKMLPTNALVNYSLGRAYSRMKQYDAAIKLLEESFNDKPGFPETSKELGLAYRRRGETTRKSDPLNTGSYVLDYHLAIKYLEHAVRLAPRDDDALAILGGLYKRLGEYQTSLDYYLRAAVVNRDVSYPLGNIGSIQWYNGNIEEARETFKHTEEIATLRIQRQGSDIYWDYYDRALARLMLNSKDEAIADYRIAIDRTPGAVDLESALDNLLFLKNTPNPKETINGLDEVIEDIKKQVARKNAVVV